MSVRPSLHLPHGFAVGASPPISREQSPGLDLTLIKRHHFRELHLTVRPLPGETLSALFKRLKKVLLKHRAVIVKQDFFGPLTSYQRTQRALQQCFGQIQWPVSWIDGADCNGGKLAGLHVLAVHGAEVKPIPLDGRVVGTSFHDGACRHCVVGDITPRNVTRSRYEQSRRAYADLDAALKLAGMDATNVVRTWFFLDDILAWYGTFNQVRAEYFRRRKVFDHMVPASTGVGACNPTGAALAVGAWAIQPLHTHVKIKEVASPLQCPAPNYGSCFSRAVEISTPEYRQLLVSGTASIEPGGRSVYDGDIAGQIALTMRVVQGILKARKMRFLDVSRASAYFKCTKDAAAFTSWCNRHGASFLPVIATRADVCRDELLFEIEMDAVVPTHHRGK